MVNHFFTYVLLIYKNLFNFYYFILKIIILQHL